MGNKKSNDAEERLREFYRLLLMVDKQRLQELIEADKKKDEQKKELQSNFAKVKANKTKQYNLSMASSKNFRCSSTNALLLDEKGLDQASQGLSELSDFYSFRHQND